MITSEEFEAKKKQLL
ncbi:hypothetical protein EAI28_20885 [Faecalicatena contorta]|nr:hypothetical protein [Faecalicatena contorta]